MSDQHIQIVRISGITCEACIKLITRTLSRMEGVNAVVSVDPDGLVKVAVNAACTKEAFEQALTGTPYTVVRIE